MPKVILADDEPIITRGIQKLIDFASMGLEVAGEYKDGREAMDAIIEEEPEIAILDISMPSMSGIEILKKINELTLATKVIFVSGFQDFEYAKAAVTYGAVDYLLKPVIKEELLKAIEKAMAGSSATFFQKADEDSSINEFAGMCNQLNRSGFIPVIAEIIQDDGMNEQVLKLTRFSYKSFLTEYIESNELGIVFNKNNNIVIVFNGVEIDEIGNILKDLGEVAKGLMNRELLFIVGDYTDNLADISKKYEECETYLGYSFFAGYIPDGLVFCNRNIGSDLSFQQDFSELAEKLITALISVNESQFEVVYQKIAKCIFKMAEGKKEDAFFYLCSLVDKAEEKVNAVRGATKQRGMGTLLSIARGCASYVELLDTFKEYLKENMRGVEQTAEATENNAINVAKSYINSHYMEDINLNVMADVVHMNPYYFSTFFKKYSGVNFKEYISKVRVEKSIQYMVSTDKKLYEIATLVGFSDARSFGEAFQRIYGETPNEYRKRIRGAI